MRSLQKVAASHSMTAAAFACQGRHTETLITFRESRCAPVLDMTNSDPVTWASTERCEVTVRVTAEQLIQSKAILGNQ